jgi:arylsulfatase A-like enzyme
MPRSLSTLLFVVTVLSGLLTLGPVGCGRPKPQPPNVILISLDTFRADRMSAYGATGGLTPSLDALAGQGTVFRHAVVSAGTTFPSHASMLTGLYPRRHAVRSNLARLPDDVPTLAEQLRAAGYECGAFVSFKAMLYHGNLGKDFDVQSDPERTSNPLRDGRETADLALAWLRERDSAKPFFLWYHNYDAHPPLRLTEYARTQLEALGYEGPFADGASVDEIRGHQKEITGSELKMAAIRALYDGEVQAADAAVGHLIEGLDHLGLLANTVLFLIADHGEGMGEHSWLGHGPILWESVIHVPLVIVDFRRPRHQVVDTTVGEVDLTPTILVLTGAATLPVQGRSLIPALQEGEIEPAPYFTEVKLLDEDERAAWYDPDTLAVYGEGFKLRRWRDQLELFDLARDPDAVSPITPANDAQVIVRADLAQQYLAGTQAANLPELDQETIEQLKALGYTR